MKKFFIMAAGVLMLAGCAHKNDSGERAKNTYKEALADSIAATTAEIDSCNNNIAILTEKVNELLPDFVAVNNAREVEGYTIFRGWESRYPLRQTGLIARVAQNEGLELIAALSGGVFDQIRVSAPSVSEFSAIVSHDQALNYRRDGLTTVMFTGAQADSIAMLIADNQLNPVTVTYLQQGRNTGSWRMPDDYKKMVSMTWLLSSTHREQNRLERRAMMLGEKIKILRQHAE